LKSIAVLFVTALAASSAAATATAEPVKNPALAAQLSVMAPRVVTWAEKLATEGRAHGVALTPAQERIARASGVRNPHDVRIIVVDRIPLPDEPQLRAAALEVGLSPSSALGMTLGYTVMVVRGYEDNVRLLSHELRHVAQYEACGGIRPFLTMHLADLAAFGYEDSPFEVDARAHEQDGPPVLRRASSGG
jgi:hypothetical protein